MTDRKTAPPEPVNTPPWIVCQIGAREHYAVARGLAEHGRLDALITDAWAPDIGAIKRWNPRLAGRSHPALAGERVHAFTEAALIRDGVDRLRRLGRASTNMRRNAWFQKKAVAMLGNLGRGQDDRIVFAYSYAALHIFREAREQGWRTVLGQIDPGPLEARIVRELIARHDPGGPNEVAKPKPYWREWREEAELADRIVVNSEWSRDALVGEGIAAEKIAIVPLAYEPANNAAPAVRRSPPERPLRALFLGQAILRKGIVELIEAARLLIGEPVEIHIVGRVNTRIEARVPSMPNVFWHGAQPRTRVHAFYRESDVFVLPTHSDGFAITQLEALASGLPVIASDRCGEAVQDGVNGLRLSHVSAEAIAEALVRLANDPELVTRLSRGACETQIPGPAYIGARLLGIFNEFPASIVAAANA